MAKRILSIASFALLLAVPLLAHHPFSTEFDWTKPVTVSGKVTQLDWANPHVHLMLNGKDTSGKSQNWDFELGSTNALENAGWSKATLKIGDTVTAEGWLSKQKSNSVNMKSVKLPGGKELWAASSIAESSAAEPAKYEKTK